MMLSLRTIVFAAIILLASVASMAEANASHTLIGTWSCYSTGRTHSSANLETITYKSDGTAIWKGYGETQSYRYSLANGVLTLDSDSSPGPLRSKLKWTPTGYATTPLGAEQLGQSCTHVK